LVSQVHKSLFLVKMACASPMHAPREYQDRAVRSPDIPAVLILREGAYTA
jgi:hypothetical protein